MSTQRDRADLAAYYEDLLREQEESELSVVEFAEEVGVSAATLYSWRRRLGRSEDRARVVEVAVVEDESDEASTDVLTVEVEGRFRIEVRRGFDEGALIRLLGVLERC